MPDPFRSSRLKIDRAKHHIGELEALVNRFRLEPPYEIIVDVDPEPGYKVHKFRLQRPGPFGEFSVVIGDAVTNLRAALDHIIYACARCSGPDEPRFKTCSFPFGKDQASFDKAVKGCTAVPEEIRRCLKQFRAYDGGHIALWDLNNVCNWDKHALVTPVLMGWETLSINVATGNIESPKNLFWDHAKNEIELFRTKTEPKYELTISLEIVFQGSKYFANHRVVAILQSLVGMVESILNTIEAQTRTLFPVAFD